MLKTTTVMNGATTTSENTSSKGLFGINGGLILIKDYFHKKIFRNMKSFLLVSVISFGVAEWVSQYVYPYPYLLIPYAVFIAADIYSAISRDIKRGIGFQSKRLKESFPIFIASFFVLYFVFWLVEVAKMLNAANAEYLDLIPLIAWTVVSIAHGLSFVKNMVLAGAMKKRVARWIYNNIDAHKNESTDALWGQYAKRKGIK